MAEQMVVIWLHNEMMIYIEGRNLGIWSSWALIVDLSGCNLSSFAKSYLKPGRVRKLTLWPGLKSQTLLTFLAAPTREMIQSCNTWVYSSTSDCYQTKNLNLRNLLQLQKDEEISFNVAQNSELEEGMHCYYPVTLPTNYIFQPISQDPWVFSLVWLDGNICWISSLLHFV